MKLSLALALLLGTSFPLAASLRDQDEVVVMLELIELTSKNLEEQQRLLKTILEFRRVREAFLQEPTSSRLATSLVRSSMRLADEIDAKHFAHLFSEEFLTELRFFASVGKEQKLSKTVTANSPSAEDSAKHTKKAPS